MPIRDVMIRLGLNSAPFVAGIRSAQVASTGLATDLTKTATAGSKSAAVLGSSFGTVGLVAGAAGVAMVKAAADFESGMSNVKATGDDAVQHIGALRQAALDAGNATKYSATEAAGGVEALLKAGVSTADVLGGGLSGALNLAAAGNLDVAGSAEAAASAMNQFKLSGQDVPHIADLLAAGAGKAQGEVSDMAEALSYVGPVAKGAHVSIEETVGAIAQLSSSGIIGSRAGESLRGVLVSLTSPSKLATSTLDKYNVSLYDAKGHFVGLAGLAQQLKTHLGSLSEEQQNLALGQIFGNAQISTARVLMDGGAEAADKWTKAVDDQGFAAEVAATKMDNLKGDLEKLKGTFDTMLISGGSGSQGGLRDAVQTLDGLLKKIQELNKNADDHGFNGPGGPFGSIFRSIIDNGRAGDIASRAFNDKSQMFKVGTKEQKVVVRFMSIGADGSIRKAVQVARAANLTPKQVTSVLKLLGWSPKKIDAVNRALYTTKQVAAVQATLRMSGWDDKKIAQVTKSLKAAQSVKDLRARLTKQGFEPDDIAAIVQLMGQLRNAPPATPKVKPKVTDPTAFSRLLTDLNAIANAPNVTKTVTTHYVTTGKKPGPWSGGRVGDWAGRMGFAGGGVVPGTPPSDPMRDNVFARDEHGRGLAVRSGEWIINQSASEKNDRLLAAINGGLDAQGILGFAKGGKVKKGGGGVSPTFLSGEKAAEEARLEQDIADGVKELATKKKDQSLTGWARRVAELELADNRAALARLRSGGSVDGTSPTDAIADAKQSLIDAANSPISLFGGTSDSPWMSGGSFAARATQKLTQIRTLAGKLYQLRQAGLNGALLSELYSLDARSGIAAADELLKNPSEIGQLNAAYSGIQSANAFAAAVGYAAPVTPGIKVAIEGFRVDLANMTAAAQIVVRDEVGRELQRNAFDSKVGV